MTVTVSPLCHDLRRAILQELLSRNISPESGRSYAVRALLDKNCELLAAWKEEELVGLMSYRVTNQGIIKRINTGVLQQNTGIGTLMVKRLCEIYKCLPQYAKSRDGRFCLKLGMKEAEIVGDLRRYELSSEAAMELLK